MSTYLKPAKPGTPSASKLTVPDLRSRKESGVKIAAVTAYDFTTAKLLDAAGVDLILVGDSLACVIQGEINTLPATLDQMVYHSRCVARGAERSVVIGDLPFMSYQVSVEQGVASAGKLLQEGRVSGVKLEGGIAVAPLIERLSAFDIPVVGHVGLTPQSYHRMGGHKRQGRRQQEGSKQVAGTRERVLEDAIAVAESGAFAVVLESIPSDLAQEITAKIDIPTIGIGAGPHCDGQILVINDLLGLDPDFSPSFCKRYAELGNAIKYAVAAYCAEVKSGVFPKSEVKPLGLAVGNK